MIEFGHLSHPGTVHACNQNTYYGNANLGVWALLDGVGGDGCGEFASSVARDALAAAVRQGRSLEDAILAADTAVNTLPREPANIRGTTALALRTVDDSHIQMAWLGSTLAFGLNSSNQLIQLTLSDAGAGASNRTKALGVTQSSRLHISETSINTADFTRILLCSEAVISSVGQERLTEILRDREVSAQELADTIIFDALDSDVEDSVTAVVLKL